MENYYHLPYCLRNLLISYFDSSLMKSHINYYNVNREIRGDIIVKPTRVSLQDMTSLSALIDLFFLKHYVEEVKTCCIDLTFDNYLNINISNEHKHQIEQKMNKPNLINYSSLYIPIPDVSNIIVPKNLTPPMYFQQFPPPQPQYFIPNSIMTPSLLPLPQFAQYDRSEKFLVNDIENKIDKFYFNKQILSSDDRPNKCDSLCFGKCIQNGTSPNNNTKEKVIEGIEPDTESEISDRGNNENLSSSGCLICNAPPTSNQSKKYLTCPFHLKLTNNAPFLLRNHIMEFERCKENLAFIKWCSTALPNIRILPPGSGLSHTVNLEYFCRFVISQEDDQLDKNLVEKLDVVVGTDSHITTLNGLGILAWGVGGVDVQMVMMGQPVIFPFCSKSKPLKFIGIRVIGNPESLVTSTDIVLYIIKNLKNAGDAIKDEIIEFFGPSLQYLPIPDRITIANMCPEYGACLAYFPFDRVTHDHLIHSGRSNKEIHKITSFMNNNRLYKSENESEELGIAYSQVINIDLSSVHTWVSGPRKPQHKIMFKDGLDFTKIRALEHVDTIPIHPLKQEIILAAVTSCSNATNPRAMLMAGLLAKRAIEKGLKLRVGLLQKTLDTDNKIFHGGCALLSPGGPLSLHYLRESLTLPYLKRLGFKIMGYNCPDCEDCVNEAEYHNLIQNIINSDYNEPTVEGGKSNRMSSGSSVLCAILSGNRNYHARELPHPTNTFLASPALVVAYAIAGTLDHDFCNTPLLTSSHTLNINNDPVFLRDIWPSRQEIVEAENRLVLPTIAEVIAHSIDKGSNEDWNNLKVQGSPYPTWNPYSTYIREPSTFLFRSLWNYRIEKVTQTSGDGGHAYLEEVRILAILGDHVTCDQISPAGSIPRNTPASKYLMDMGLNPREFNSFGARRGNWELMTRGTFTNPRLVNLMLTSQANDCHSNKSSLVRFPRPKNKITMNQTIYYPTGKLTSIYDAAKQYFSEDVPIIVIAGSCLGTGSIREWASKGPRYLGIRAFIAVSFDPNFRSNLVSVGIMPLSFTSGQNATSLGLQGNEKLSLEPLDGEKISFIESFNLENDREQLFTFKPSQNYIVKIQASDEGSLTPTSFIVKLCADTKLECDYLSHGGILPYHRFQIKNKK